MINLLPHQQKALDLTAAHNRVAYYLDMGLGKTFVGAEKLMQLNSRINLVIVQKSKVQDWVDHFTEHYTRNCVADLTDSKSIKWFMEQAKCEVPTLLIGVINYELTFRRKVLKTLSGFTLMLDESSLIQNETAKRSKFVLGLKPENVILLSGTPTGGKYEKLWSQCQLLGWKISKDLFMSQYVETEWFQDNGFWKKKIVGYKNVDRLKQKLATHGAVFMTTDDAGLSLPEKQTIWVKHPPNSQYKKFRKEWVVETDRRQLIGDTTFTRRLYSRQLCGLYNPARYDAFRDLLQSTDDRVIVFYNFTDEFMELLKICDEVERPASVINGAMKCLDAYENRSDSVTFIQYQAGARGGNYQKANKIIYFSLPESWELWEQSQKRIHRIGQDRPCFYYLLISPGTVEENIFHTLEMRKDYNDALFEAYNEADDR